MVAVCVNHIDIGDIISRLMKEKKKKSNFLYF